MLNTEERITQDVLVVPFEPSEAQKFKTVLVGKELIIYPDHLKFYQVATPQQRAQKILDRLARRKPNPSAIQIPDEALRRENMYE
jgi:hypothetical protein